MTENQVLNVELFAVESAASSSDRQKVIDDTYKLLRELKDMYDRIYKHYDINPAFKLYGVRTGGLEAHFYMYDKTFVDASRGIHLASVVLPNRVEEIENLLEAIGMALALRDRIANSCVELQGKQRQQLVPREGPATSKSEKESSSLPSLFGGKDGEGDDTKSNSKSKSEGETGASKRGTGGRRRMAAISQEQLYTETEDVEERSNRNTSVSFGNRISDGYLVAIKRFHLGSGKRPRRELRALTIAKQAKIPFVVELLAAFRPINNLEWIRTELTLVMPRLERLPLESLGLDEMAKVMRELCTALKELHRFGVIHMDVKPSNLMRDPMSKELRLIDFDLSMTECPGTFFTHPSGTKVTT